MLELVDPGALATIQDGGRAGYGHLGVPASGAADAFGLAVANLLAGVSPGAAALELTLGGAELLAVETCAVALGGADLGAEFDDGRPLVADAVHHLRPGTRVRFRGAVHGLRAYVALAGGIAAARELGSASTYGPGRLGFAGGRPLRAGDRLVPGRRGDLGAVGHTWPSVLAPHPATAGGPLGIVPGPDLEAVPPGTLVALAAMAWTVEPASDRMGIRLAGPALEPGSEIVSHPLMPGAVQLPPGGRPIVALVDGPTIGGYPVIGVVPRADLPRLGQLRPGDTVRFAAETAERARVRWQDQQALLARARAWLRQDAVWHRLADHAGG